MKSINVITVVLIFELSASLSGSSTVRSIPGTTADDLRHRSPDIHWPQGFDPSGARYFAHNEIIIDTDCGSVWKRLIKADEWQSWLITVKNVRMPAGHTELAPGLSFQWSVLGGDTQSTIGEFTPASRLGWFAFYGRKPTWYHNWLLTRAQGSCKVVTEEVGISADAARLAASGDTGIHRAHDLWLASLRWAAGA